MPTLVRPALGIVAALAVSVGFAGVAQADTRTPSEIVIPTVPPGDDRGDQVSRDTVRPDLLPEVVRALADRQDALNRAKTDIAARERTLQVNEFVKQRAAAEKKARYADQVKKLGYDPKKTAPRDIAKKIMLAEYKWGEDQFGCLNKIFTQESQWKWNATNPSSGAYGIPQSLPANKMATEGDDWKTNPATQIKWGLKYIKQRYGTPCQAWSFKQGAGWY
ncbi:MAG: transglycosylase SLT domain-containing protein [Micropruina sp.]|uniref:aggregation-promoting factor C-terminal-like domain-containing protein n=1 Tax=Micropruina sp. TaxID=2737536 RepID=UPI0039E46AD0